MTISIPEEIQVTNPQKGRDIVDYGAIHLTKDDITFAITIIIKEHVLEVEEKKYGTIGYYN